MTLKSAQGPRKPIPEPNINLTLRQDHEEKILENREKPENERSEKTLRKIDEVGLV
jgi:hypothetical protein